MTRLLLSVALISKAFYYTLHFSYILYILYENFIIISHAKLLAPLMKMNK